MRVKDGFMLREIAGSWVVVPIGNRVVEFNGLITLNESGFLLWKQLEKDVDVDDLVDVMVNEYIVDESLAREDVNKFILGLQEKGLLV